MLAQFWKFVVNCYPIGLTSPVACTQAHVPLTFGHGHRLHFSRNLLKKDANRLRLK